MATAKKTAPTKRPAPVAAKKTGAKKASAKASAKKTSTAKARAKKTSAKKTGTKRVSAKKTATTRANVKAAGKRSATKAGSSRRSASKTTAAKKSTGRKYGPRASEDVREELHEMKRGQLRIGKSREKVTNPKQAIAIGLAKARREGAKVPPNPNTGR